MFVAAGTKRLVVYRASHSNRRPLQRRRRLNPRKQNIARLSAVLLIIAVALGVIAPTAAALPKPPWKELEEILGGLRQAWKDSPEARFAAKVVRKSTTRGVTKWRNSKGVVCPWRAAQPTYCQNGWVVAAVPIDFSLHGHYVGSVKKGTVLSAACITANERFVRVLWPVSRVPSVFVSQKLLRPFLGVTATLPTC